MLVVHAVQEYLCALTNRSPHTRRCAKVALGQFADWCQEQGIELECVKAAVVNRYTDYLRKRELSPSSMHTYTMRIKAFLTWCAREETLEDLISERVARRVDVPRRDEKVIEVFTAAQYKALYDACAQERYEPTIYRDRAILSLLMDTGVRAAELCGLTLENVYITGDDPFIRVLGKGRKQREVGLGATSRKLLRVYIVRWRKADKAEQHVFVNRMGEPMTPGGLNTMLYRLEQWSGVTGVRVSAHTFRHSYACAYLLQGGDVYKLSRLMGHTSIRVTERYLQAVSARQARQGESVLDRLKDL